MYINIDGGKNNTAITLHNIGAIAVCNPSP